MKYTSLWSLAGRQKDIYFNILHCGIHRPHQAALCTPVVSSRGTERGRFLLGKAGAVDLPGRLVCGGWGEGVHQPPDSLVGHNALRGCTAQGTRQRNPTLHPNIPHRFCWGTVMTPRHQKGMAVTVCSQNQSKKKKKKNQQNCVVKP